MEWLPRQVVARSAHFMSQQRTHSLFIAVVAIHEPGLARKAMRRQSDATTASTDVLEHISHELVRRIDCNIQCAPIRADKLPTANAWSIPPRRPTSGESRGSVAVDRTRGRQRAVRGGLWHDDVQGDERCGQQEQPTAICIRLAVCAACGAALKALEVFFVPHGRHVITSALCYANPPSS